MAKDIFHEAVKVALQSDPDTEMQTIFDTAREHYQIVNVGWQREWHRVYGTVIHIDIKDGKISYE